MLKYKLRNNALKNGPSKLRSLAERYISLGES